MQHLLSDHNMLLSRVFLPIGEYLNVTTQAAAIPHFVTPENTVEDAFEAVVANRAHRIYVLESKDNKKLIGVISLVDLLELIAKSVSP